MTLTSETFVVYSGYSRDNRKYIVRYMTFEEACNLRYGQVIKFIDNKGCIRDIKVNGQVKRWKRSPLNCRIPLKYGLYEYASVEYINGIHAFGVELVIVME